MKVQFAELRIFAICIILSAIIFGFDSVNLLSLPKSAIQYITSPIQYGFYRSGATVGDQFEIISLQRRASQENKALREQLASLLSENSGLRTKLSEIESLIDQQQSLNPLTFKTVATRPVGLSRYMLLDRGSNDGISAGMAVVYKNNLVGVVKEVTANKSSVILTSDPDSKISAVISNVDGRAKGLVYGQFGAQILLDRVLHKEPLGVGDIVYTEGTEGQLPRGLVLGSVTEIIGQDNEIFKQAKIDPGFDLTDLTVVFVITN